MESDESTTDVESTQAKPKETKYKYGIIYLSYIPEGLNVTLLREIMGEFGEVGRIYLEPEHNNKKHRTYLEGWIEFKKKRVAKLVAKSLNGTPLKYGRKHCKMNGQVWSVKYLHRFKWAHLTEQLAMDKATKEQKRRFELNQTKKQVDFQQKILHQSNFMKKNSQSKVQTTKVQSLITKQKQSTHDDTAKSSFDEDLLSNIFRFPSNP